MLLQIRLERVKRLLLNLRARAVDAPGMAKVVAQCDQQQGGFPIGIVHTQALALNGRLQRDGGQ